MATHGNVYFQYTPHIKIKTQNILQQLGKYQSIGQSLLWGRVTQFKISKQSKNSYVHLVEHNVKFQRSTTPRKTYNRLQSIFI